MLILHSLLFPARYKAPGSSGKTTTSPSRHHDDATTPANPLAAEPFRPQPYAQRPIQKRPQTGRGRNLEEVRQGFDPASSPRLRDLVNEDGNASSPMSTLSGVSRSGPPSPSESSKANHRYGLGSRFAPKPPEEPMNSATKRGRAARGLDSRTNITGVSVISRKDPLTEFAERAAAKADASTRGAIRDPGGDVMRNSIQAAGSRLGLRIMMADELGDVSGDDFAGGPVVGDVEVQRLKPRERSSEEELNEARRKLDFENVRGSPDGYEGRFGQSRQSEMGGESLLSGRQVARKLDFGEGGVDDKKAMLGATEIRKGSARETGIAGAETNWVPDGTRKLGDSDVSLVSDIRKESSAMWSSKSVAAAPSQKRGDVSPLVFTGVKRSSGPDVELRSSRERIMLADSLELEVADVSASGAYVSAGVADVTLTESSEKRGSVGSGPGAWKQSDGGRPMLQGQNESTGSRHVSPLRPFADEGGESDREVTPRQHYVMMSDSDRESGSEEEGEEKTVEKRGVNEGWNGRSVLGGRFEASKEGGGVGMTERRRKSERLTEAKIRRESSHSWESKSGDDFNGREPANRPELEGSRFRASGPANLRTDFDGSKVEARAAVGVGRSEERGPLLSFSAGGQRIMLASDLLDQLEDEGAVSIEGAEDEQTKESESHSGYMNAPKEAEGFSARRISGGLPGIGSREEETLKKESTFEGFKMDESWTRRTSGELEVDGIRTKRTSDELDVGENWTGRPSGELEVEVIPTERASGSGVPGDARNVTVYEEDFEEIAHEIADVDEEGDETPSVKRVLESDPAWERRTERRVTETDRWAGVRSDLDHHDSTEIDWDRAERVGVKEGTAHYGGSDWRGMESTGAETERKENGSTAVTATDSGPDTFESGLPSGNETCRKCGRFPQTKIHSPGLKAVLEVGSRLPDPPEKKASSSVAVQVGTLNNKGTQVEFDEERGFLWEGTTSLGLSSEPAGLLDRARASAPAAAAAFEGIYVGGGMSAGAALAGGCVGEETSARACGGTEAPARELRPPAKWLAVHRKVFNIVICELFSKDVITARIIR